MLNHRESYLLLGQQDSTSPAGPRGTERPDAERRLRRLGPRRSAWKEVRRPGTCNEFCDLLIGQSSFALERTDDGGVLEPEVLASKEPGRSVLDDDLPHGGGVSLGLFDSTFSRSPAGPGRLHARASVAMTPIVARHLLARERVESQPSDP
jgi:hypothetical protein